MNESSRWVRDGIAYGVLAHIFWGLIPLYFKNLDGVPAREILAHRVVWSALLLAGLVTLSGRWGDMRRAYADPFTRTRLALSTAFIGLNWYVYIYSVVSGQIVQAVLGYFILPMVNVALAIIIFGERPRPLQWFALALASVGVAVLVYSVGVFPWIAITLAVSFSSYGAIRKTTPVDGIVGLTVETAYLTPLALAFLVYWATEGRLGFGRDGWRADLLIAFSGVATTLPLICYTQAVRRLNFTTIGFLQFVSPSIALLFAVFRYNEAFTADHAKSYGFIWAGLAVFVADAVFHTRRTRRAVRSIPVPAAS